jgi:hypothetical protein
MLISRACLRVRISSACASEARSGCDFLFACSEDTFQDCSEYLEENAFVVKTSPTFNERSLGVFAVSAASTLEGGTTPPTELTTPGKSHLCHQAQHTFILCCPLVPLLETQFQKRKSDLLLRQRHSAITKHSPTRSPFRVVCLFLLSKHLAKVQ